MRSLHTTTRESLLAAIKTQYSQKKKKKKIIIKKIWNVAGMFKQLYNTTCINIHKYNVYDVEHIV